MATPLPIDIPRRRSVGIVHPLTVRAKVPQQRFKRRETGGKPGVTPDKIGPSNAGANVRRWHIHHEESQNMGIIKEFKEFALRGNVLDLAVAVIIGAEFGKIVNSMINDLLLPLITKGMGGGVDFSNNFYALSTEVTATSLVEARKQGAVFAWGSFITVSINFVILALCIFLVVKAFNTAKKRFDRQQPAPPPAGPTNEEKLLIEIRDLLARGAR